MSDSVGEGEVILVHAKEAYMDVEINTSHSETQPQMQVKFQLRFAVHFSQEKSPH
jgi:hypothetical protein